MFLCFPLTYNLMLTPSYSLCQHGFLMLNGRCVAECPAERYYRGKSGRHEACIPCYYTCRTCSGSNDYQVSFWSVYKLHLKFVSRCRY